MATIPTVPSFVTGETPSIAKLNQLASCVSFIYTIPAFGQLTGSGQSLTNNTATALTWSVTTDRDTGWAAGHPTRYTAQTPGYYQLDALAAWASNATGNRQAYFQVTTGANNPGGAGLTTAFGAVAGLTDGTGNPTRFTLAALCPYLYLLDYLEVYAYQNSGGALNTAACSWQVTLESLGP